ncbi:DUF2920 family protein, partial [Campylobacter volucris]|uniref:DUF2920 family protein n=1 Tax=Campylobacter volucris TaxID=1031542 RepID=UPI0018A04088
DVELNIKRESKLEYRITYDDSKEMKAIVFILDGYGANVDLSVIDFTRQFIAQKFDVIAVSVLYHCFSCRINEKDKKYSATFSHDEQNLNHLRDSLKKINIDTSTLNLGNINNYIANVDSMIDTYKAKNILNENYKFYFTSTMLPANNEYQNYGIMAAIDVINALKHLMHNFEDMKKKVGGGKISNLPKIYGGRSYGGYLALLIAKIAPWYIDGVIDNSGEAMLLLRYIIGKDFNAPDMYYNLKNYQVGIFLKTHWTADKSSLYCFKDENFLIRTLLNKDHLILQAQKNKDIVYVSYHSSADTLTSYEHKTQLMNFIQTLGYDVTFHLIEEKDIDGKYIKNLNHGCGISVKALFNKELPKMLEKLKDKTFSMKEDSISYPCKNKVFTFKDKDDKFVLEII